MKVTKTQTLILLVLRAQVYLHKISQRVIHIVHQEYEISMQIPTKIYLHLQFAHRMELTLNHKLEIQNQNQARLNQLKI